MQKITKTIAPSVSRILILVRKEFVSYFNSSIAYIVTIFFLTFSSMWFFIIQQFSLRNVADLRPYFAIIPSLFIAIIPMLTMRAWAEERKLGTHEILLTLPYNEFELVLGKFLAMRLMIYMILTLTLPVPLLVLSLGDFEFGQIIGQYLGVLFFSAPIVAIGLFASSVSTNQISALIVSVVILIGLSLVNQVALLFNPSRVVGAFFEYLSLSRHFRSFEIGLIDTRDIIYYLTLAWLFLYLNVKVLIRRKRS